MAQSQSSLAGDHTLNGSNHPGSAAYADAATCEDECFMLSGTKRIILPWLVISLVCTWHSLVMMLWNASLMVTFQMTLSTTLSQFPCFTLPRNERKSTLMLLGFMSTRKKPNTPRNCCLNVGIRKPLSRNSRNALLACWLISFQTSRKVSWKSRHFAKPCVARLNLPETRSPFWLKELEDLKSKLTTMDPSLHWLTL